MQHSPGCGSLAQVHAFLAISVRPDFVRFVSSVESTFRGDVPWRGPVTAVYVTKDGLWHASRIRSDGRIQYDVAVAPPAGATYA